MQRLVLLIELAFSSTYRYTNADIDVWYGGNRYLARGLETSPTAYSMNMNTDTAWLKFDNVDKTLTAIIEAGEIRDKWVTVREAALDEHGQVLGQAIQFLGRVVDFEYTREAAEFTVGNIMSPIWARKIPRRQASPSCQVRYFRDTECGYTGAETWCDMSWDRCVALGNQVNFQGFRWISWLEQNPEIWWGRAPKV